MTSAKTHISALRLTDDQIALTKRLLSEDFKLLKEIGEGKKKRGDLVAIRDKVWAEIAMLFRLVEKVERDQSLKESLREKIGMVAEERKLLHDEDVLLRELKEKLELADRYANRYQMELVIESIQFTHNEIRTFIEFLKEEIKM